MSFDASTIFIDILGNLCMTTHLVTTLLLGFINEDHKKRKLYKVIKLRKFVNYVGTSC